MRKDYVIGLNLSGGGPDPDQNLYQLYRCGGDLNYNGFCNPEIDRLIDQQSAEPDQEKRKQLVWEIERKLAEDGARPIIFYNRDARFRRWWGLRFGTATKLPHRLTTSRARPA